MQSENAIEITNIKKKFKVFYDKGQSFKEKLLFRSRNRYEERVVIDDVSLTVKKGEAIGLIGHNGCGKSTMLKLMTRILYPDAGKIEINGRVSSLIELGAGFHPDMSGRENIYTNASIFGLTKKEIDSRLDDIIKFSELEKFIDNPVRTYSSGMYMRLAFSVAINVNADVLLIDEILAVGDANFQSKCFRKLKEIKSSGTTIVIVSHALGQIEQICDRSIWINDGKIRAEGDPRDIHPMYMEFMGSNMKEAEDDIDPSQKKRWGSREAEIKEVKLINSKGVETGKFATGSSMLIHVEYEVKEKVPDAIFGIGVIRSDGLYCYGVNTRIDRLETFDIEKSGSFEINLERLNLMPGDYNLKVTIEKGDGIPVDYYNDVRKFTMYSPIDDAGSFRLDHVWKT